MRCSFILWPAVLALSLAGCPKNPSNPSGTNPAPGEEKKAPAAKAEAEKKASEPAAGATAKEETLPEKPVVEISTSLGKIKLELYARKAPKTVANFLKHVRSGHYNGTIFHRVISSFMIQGGGFDANMSEKPSGDPIQNEGDNGLSNARGTIAMARTPNPHSATAQFFINVVDNQKLDHREKTMEGWGYCVFGKVTGGMDVVDKIKEAETTTQGMHENVPRTAVVINEAKIVK